MTFAPETQIVASAYERGVYRYTARHDTRNWTVEINAADFEGLNKAQRRAILAGRMSQAMRGPPDDV